MARAFILNGMVETGIVVVPAPVMVAADHFWLGAAMVAVALAASVLQARQRIRARTDRQQRLLSTVEHAWNIGADPAAALWAMRGLGEDDDPPDEEPDPWYHRPPGR